MKSTSVWVEVLLPQRAHQVADAGVELLDDVAVGAGARAARELARGIVVEVRIAVCDVHEEALAWSSMKRIASLV